MEPASDAEPSGGAAAEPARPAPVVPDSLSVLASTSSVLPALSLSSPQPFVEPASDSPAAAGTDTDSDSAADPQPAQRPKRKRKKSGKYHPLTDQQRLDILGLHIDQGKTAASIQRLYKDRGIHVPLGTLDTLFRKQARGENFLHTAKRRPRGTTYTDEDKRLVCQAQTEHNDWNYEQLKKAWKEARPDSTRCPSNYTIHKWLQEADFTDKLLIPVPQARNAPYNIEARKEYSARAAGWDRDTLVFIDETSFDRNLHRSRGRSKRGTVATYQALNSPGPGLKVCAAVSPSLGLVMYEPQLTAWNGDDFARFMTKLCAHPGMQQQSMKFVMDNVRLHHTEVVKDALRAQPIQHDIEFLPTYSPHLNPIEYCFHNWKTEIKHVDQLHDRRGLREQLDDTRTCITAHLVTRILDHVYQYYTHCLQGLPLEDFKPIGCRVLRARQEAERQRQDREEDEKKE